MLVIGGTPELTLLKTKVFAAPLKADAKAVTFKTVKAEDNAELDKLQAELDGPLVEQVGACRAPPARRPFPCCRKRRPRPATVTSPPPRPRCRN